jgi:hypothetical protein
MVGKQDEVFAPGQVAPMTGLYEVHHERHRIPHLVTISEGRRLPECAHCGRRVRFVLEAAADVLELDYDFVPRSLELIPDEEQAA